MLVGKVYDERGHEINACSAPTALTASSSVLRIPFRSASKILSIKIIML